MRYVWFLFSRSASDAIASFDTSFHSHFRPLPPLTLHYCFRVRLSSRKPPPSNFVPSKSARFYLGRSVLTSSSTCHPTTTPRTTPTTIATQVFPLLLNHRQRGNACAPSVSSKHRHLRLHLRTALTTVLLCLLLICKLCFPFLSFLYFSFMYVAQYPVFL